MELIQRVDLFLEGFRRLPIEPFHPGKDACAKGKREAKPQSNYAVVQVRGWLPENHLKHPKQEEAQSRNKGHEIPLPDG